MRDRAEVDGLFKNLRESQGKEAGEEAFNDLVDFVSEQNAAAVLALNKRREALVAFHRLDVPSTLNLTFLSTNLIENALRNWRAASGNVKRWNEKKDMVSRWMAAGLLWVEAGFQKVRHAEDLPRLALALELSATDSAAVAKEEATSSLFYAIRKGGTVLSVIPISTTALDKIFRKRSAEAGVSDLDWHDLRRTVASNLLDAGADISTVAGILGHSNINTTARYDRRGERARIKASELIFIPYFGRK